MRLDGGGVEDGHVRTRIAGIEGTAELTLHNAAGVELGERHTAWAVIRLSWPSAAVGFLGRRARQGTELDRELLVTRCTR
ncbi:MAG: hypothetical protein QOH89_3700 [Pseudonocardiales bacterium]|nr:hypothetical protein [Pseudonocardiales bacterium]